ncbi:hypothetical protein SAMN04487846_0598 [Microbacterium sp. cf046]|uniref:hypothetical protein n=1 Tax=Microbacterium sp. cf046 TaxID=1761803 RepID=UPI0008E3CF6A|nr:hypothetical protein [Microbacterium sp. cf046]SFR92012.1 hypothetical protein SAMN04487846_0598 [Microbacterium sp. cf046]
MTEPGLMRVDGTRSMAEGSSVIRAAGELADAFSSIDCRIRSDLATILRRASR